MSNSNNSQKKMNKYCFGYEEEWRWHCVIEAPDPETALEEAEEMRVRNALQRLQEHGGGDWVFAEIQLSDGTYLKIDMPEVDSGGFKLVSASSLTGLDVVLEDVSVAEEGAENV